MILIHKRKSALPFGTVTTTDGAILGVVRRVSKIAAGTRGQRRTFYSAEVIWRVNGFEHRAYIGTRYVLRSQAVAALRDFWREFPPTALLADAGAIQDPRWVTGSASRRHMWALNRAVQQWSKTRRTAHPFNNYPRRAA